VTIKSKQNRKQKANNTYYCRANNNNKHWTPDTGHRTQGNEQASKQTNKQTNSTNKQTNRQTQQTNKQTKDAGSKN